MRQKFFFFDIDGTLNDGTDFYGGISDSTISAIQELKRNGHHVAIATGRPYEKAKGMAELVHIESMVCNGGYACYERGVCLESRGLDRADCMHVIQECLRAHIPFCVSCDDTFAFHTHEQGFLEAVRPCVFRGTLEVHQSLNYAEIPEIHRILIAMKPAEERLIKDYRSLLPMRYHDTYVVVEPDDKFHGIETMMRHWQGNLEDVVVFGDGRNDLKMFEQAAFSIAMGNAVEEVKQSADFVTRDAGDDGIRYALRHFGWI